MHTLMNNGREDVVYAVQAKMQWKQKADENLVREDDDGLEHMEAVTCESRWRCGPACMPFMRCSYL
jgi:hypothetical protein